MTDYIDDTFGPTGALSQKFPGYSPREGQVALARAVDAAITAGGGSHLVAEAPTGTGKSLAYAVPAAYHAAHLRGGDTRSSAILVTANIALQEQLVRKDLPLLAEILPWKFSYALLKGKNNYLCTDKLENGAAGKVDPADELMHRQILKWAETTESGDVSELTFEPPGRLWSRFSVSSDDCVGKECEFYSVCPSERARRRAAEADIVVTNYHLFFADMRVREITAGFASILPKYRVAVLDEGHKAVDIARDFFGFKITEGSMRWVGSMLPNEEKMNLEREQNSFFSSLLSFKRSGNYKARIRAPQAVASDQITQALAAAEVEYLKILREMGDPESMSLDELKRAKKIASRSNRAREIRLQIDLAMRLYVLPKLPWRAHPTVEPGETAETRWYWSDPAAGGDNTVKSEAQLGVIEDVFFIEEEQGRASLCSKPISVAKLLKDQLFNERHSVSVTSATLVAKGSFDFITEDLGVEKPKTLIAASPFSWRDQALLVLPQDVPEPNDMNFTRIAAERCVQVIELARGRTLALFTSYKNLNAAHEKAMRSGYRVLRQGDMPRTRLIDEFRKDVNSVLMGVESFWAGVDVPGESLSCVFMDRLPFMTPEDPVLDALTERDKEWFMKYSVPKAIIAFKQGFGRLIRTTTDRGVVVVLDKRISTKFYGKLFVQSLPSVQQSRNIEDVRRFLDKEPLVLVPGPSMISIPVKARGSLFDQA
jgi:ATP-dependent DNA helicase DinG